MDKLDKAIERLKLAAQMSEQFYQAPLIIATSGGKDSDVCVKLAQIAGIRCEFMHSHTSVDAPETVYHVRQQFRELELDGYTCTIDMPTYKGKRVNMWTLIPQKSMPPTRIVRYCCAVLKETGGAGRMIATGVRWSESVNRKKTRGIYEKTARDPEKRIILSNDNDDARRLFENCRLKAKRVCNPIIDWTEDDVWNFLHDEKVNTNPLYECGFSRVGCIGCPMAGKKTRKMEFAMYPTYERAYIRAFGNMLEAMRSAGIQPRLWKTKEDVFHWWMEDDVIPGQVSFEEEEKHD